MDYSSLGLIMKVTVRKKLPTFGWLVLVNMNLMVNLVLKKKILSHTGSYSPNGKKHA